MFNQAFTQLAAYVESVRGGDEAKIMSAGMDVRAVATTSNEVAVPEGLMATASDHDGEIDLQWNSVNGAQTRQRLNHGSMRRFQRAPAQLSKG